MYSRVEGIHIVQMISSKDIPWKMAVLTDLGLMHSLYKSIVSDYKGKTIHQG